MMSDRIAPFVSSSPPPFDEENFKFEEDDYDLYRRNDTGNQQSLEDVPDVIQEVNLETEINQFDEFPCNEDAVVEDEAEEEFEEFLDYQTTASCANSVFPTNDVSLQTRDLVCSQITGDRNESNQENLECKSTEVDVDENDRANPDVGVEVDSEEEVESEFGSATRKDKANSTPEEDGAEFPDEGRLAASRAVDEEERSVRGQGGRRPTELPPSMTDDCLDQGIQEDFSGEECWAQFEDAVEQLPAIEPLCCAPASQHDDDDDDDDDDFGGFEGAVKEPIRTTSVIPHHQDRFKNYLCEAFHMVSDSKKHPVKSLVSIVTSDSKPDKIWKQIRSIETTPALTMQWKTSLLLKSFLKSINVSQQSRDHSLFPNVPVFAVNLGLLEPRKLHGGTSPDGEDANPTEIPKVEFDWANSVLMDPLDVGNICHLNLDFFGDEVLTSSMSPACRKEKELLESLEPRCNGPHKSLSLHNFLSTIAPSNTTLIRSPSDPSIPPQLKAILSCMPDLSFMQAKVLMFPLREEYVDN